MLTDNSKMCLCMSSFWRRQKPEQSKKLMYKKWNYAYRNDNRKAKIWSKQEHQIESTLRKLFTIPNPLDPNTDEGTTQSIFTKTHQYGCQRT